MTRAFALCLTLVLLAAPAAAQRPDSPPLVKYGKWVLAAGAVGMNLLAARAHDDAEAAFDQIEDACFADRTRCLVDLDGRYADPGIESLYQTSLHEDRLARRWLILGETALIGAAAMFVWELTRASHEPDNIPFEPEVRSLRRATGVGVRVSW